MNVLLRKRATDLIEYMDQSDCDRQKLFKTYQQFSRINSLTSGWRKVYQKLLYPEMLKEKRQYKLLDIGFGGGDISFLIQALAQKDSIDLEITAIDMDPRAMDYIQSIDDHKGIRFLCTSIENLSTNGCRYDFIISNHLVHHLAENEFRDLQPVLESMAEKRVILNDIKRSDLAWLAFASLAPIFFHRSYIVKDGLRSIRRSYSRTEAENIINTNWKVLPLFPFRLLFYYENKI